MDDQWEIDRLGNLILSFLLRKAIASSHASLVFNINSSKHKTGIFLQSTAHLSPDQLTSLSSLLLDATIITPSTPLLKRGLIILGSPLRQSSPEFIHSFLINLLLSALNDGPANLVRLKSLQNRYQLFTKSFVHRFTHVFRGLPPCFTYEFQLHIQRIFTILFDITTGTGPTPPPLNAVDGARIAQLFLPYNLGGMGLPNPQVIRYAAFFGSRWSSLSLGQHRFAISFPSLTALSTSPPRRYLCSRC